MTTLAAEPATPAARARRWLGGPVGLAIGGAAAFAELPLLVLCGLALLVSGAWRGRDHPVTAAIRRRARSLSRFHAWRLATFHSGEATENLPCPRPLSFLWCRLPVALLGNLILILIASGATITTGAILAWSSGRNPDGIPPSPFNMAYLSIVVMVLAFIAFQGLAGIAALERRVAVRFLGPTDAQLLRRRIDELSTSRADVVAAVDDERRRIERDLHDGVQQQLVALGMLIGRARRSGDTERGAELLAAAHAQSQALLSELRDVTWRIYPAALDEAGLHAAVESVCERSGIPVDLDFDAEPQPGPAVATAAYFVVCEAVTNAAKHSGAERVAVTITGGHDRLRVVVADDGVGGARQAGRGLAGLQRRVAAVDGDFTVDSPPGGPTTITVELPCD